jgi:hypothetical protein
MGCFLKLEDSRKGAPMFMSQVYMWPLAMAVGGRIIASALRCLTLFIGLRLALKDAPKGHQLLIYREFARALSIKWRTEVRGAGPTQPPMADLRKTPEDSGRIRTASR